MTNGNVFPPSPLLPMPAGHTEESLTAFFASVELEGSPKAEMANYWREDRKRFVYTLGLAPTATGECLELGSNPYYTTLLLRQFTNLKLTLANFFGTHVPARASHAVSFVDPISSQREAICFSYFHFNIERDQFPFRDQQFDVVLFCEILEHLQNDPVRVFSEIKRVLKPSGHLILTTPNVSRLENVGRIIAGANIYDPYSGYGPYGRHNREYNRHELSLLLDYCGFDIDIAFSADVHENVADRYVSIPEVARLLRHREHDLGQYLFIRAINARPAKGRRPAWLYRSYPAGELEL